MTRSMSTLSRAILIVALLVSTALYASTMTPQIGGGISQFDGGVGTSGTVAPQPTGKNPAGRWLSSHLLQTDAASKVCIAGGC